MTHSNLILTEKAIKKHCKRLQKEIQKYNQELSLGTTQNLFARTLGFNNFHELQKILNNKPLTDLTNHEKLIFIVLSLIIDNENSLAFKILDEYYNKQTNKIIIDLLFDKYQRSSIITVNTKQYTTKEGVFIKLLKLVREKQNFASAYFIFLREVNMDLWNIINTCGRGEEAIKSKNLTHIFNQYNLESI